MYLSESEVKELGWEKSLRKTFSFIGYNRLNALIRKIREETYLGIMPLSACYNSATVNHATSSITIDIGFIEEYAAYTTFCQWLSPGNNLSKLAYKKDWG